MRAIATVVLLAAVGACAPLGPQRVEEENPTVSYTVYDEDDMRQAAAEADEYCYQNYHRTARIIGDLVTRGDRVVTFECVVA